MSAINAALDQIDRVAEQGDLTAARQPGGPLELETLAEPILLPDGKRIYPPRLHGQPIDELACALLDMENPAESTFLRLTGPPGSGKSQIARAVAYRLWQARGREVQSRHGAPFYGYIELAGGPSSDEYLFRHEFVPAADDAGTVRLVDSAFVQAMREGWVVMIDEVNTIRDVALLSINACLDGRLSLYLPATGETVLATPGFACLLAYNPGLLGATDIPDAWHSRFPATLEVTSNWPALAELGAPRQLVTEASALDRQRIAGEDGLCWTPQFRDIEALWRMTCQVGERAALALFVSNLLEQAQAGKIQEAEAAAVCRMLDQAGYAHLKVSATGRVPSLHGYPRGDLMTAAHARGGRPAVFVQQLHRAAEQRGKLDPVYQDLSDHWTAILQRLYPVWALIGPGLSDPGHIEIHSRTVYLDSDTLLGPREQIAAGRLEQRAILRCFGVAIHETLHAKHTKRWAIEHDIELSESENPADRQLAIDRRLLEEPRMEALGVREHPPATVRGRFVRHTLETAVTDVILPAFAAQLLAAATAGRALTRDLAGRASVYLQARTHYGILAPALLDAVRAVWRQVLGEGDLAALDALFARVVWIDDGDLDALDRAAHEYRAIIRPADPPPADGHSNGHGQDNRTGDSAAGPPAGEDGTAEEGSPSAGSLGEALQQALQGAAEGQLEQLDADVDLQQVLEHAAGRGEDGSHAIANFEFERLISRPRRRSRS